MTYEMLDYFCEKQCTLFNCSIRLYQKGSFVKFFSPNRFQPNDTELPLNLISITFNTDKPIDFYEEETFVVGIVQDENSDYSLVVGPVRFGELTESDIMSVIQKHNLPQILKDSIHSFLEDTPIMLTEIFLEYLCMLYTIVNGKIIRHNEILKYFPHETIPQKSVLKNTIKAKMGFHIPSEYEETLVYCIKNGLVNEIDNLQYDQFKGRVGKLGPSRLRSIKNSLIILNSMCIRAAIQGGVERETACTIGELYAQKIEDCQTINDLARLSPIIRHDYCQRVHNIKTPKIDNILILRATKYVNDRLYQKTTAKEIANYLGITPEYLSAKFKETIGKSVPKYINEQKISEAKKLLRFTDKSLVEISNMLAFSSQSYFQNQFKKIRKITPAKYREKYRKTTNV